MKKVGFVNKSWPFFSLKHTHSTSINSIKHLGLCVSGAAFAALCVSKNLNATAW